VLRLVDRRTLLFRRFSRSVPSAVQTATTNEGKGTGFDQQQFRESTTTKSKVESQKRWQFADILLLESQLVLVNSSACSIICDGLPRGCKGDAYDQCTLF